MAKNKVKQVKSQRGYQVDRKRTLQGLDLRQRS